MLTGNPQKKTGSGQIDKNQYPQLCWGYIIIIERFFMIMNNYDFLELIRKKDRAHKRAQWLSNLQLGSSSVGILCLIAGFFLVDRQPVWFLACLLFTVISFVLGFIASYFRKTANKIDAEMKKISMGGSGVGKTRFTVRPSILNETEE